VAERAAVEGGHALIGRGAALAAALLLPLASHAASLRYCDRPLDLTPTQQDRLFRWGGVVRQALAAAAAPVALVSRSGLDLQRFGLRYSHAGLALQASGNGPWSVRQLYFACDEGRPRLFDQGLSGFLLGIDEADVGYLSIVVLPPDAAEALAAAALDNRTALGLLHPRYSANAYAWGLDYQNCNQWVAELMAAAWGGAAGSRPDAQAWLRNADYLPTAVQVDSPWLRLAGWFVPYLHQLDHPAEARAAHRYEITMPASLETFVRQRYPAAERTEICHRGGRIVVHRGWSPVAEGCEPGPGDEVVLLD
jgi:hypothetical protein